MLRHSSVDKTQREISFGSFFRSTLQLWFILESKASALGAFLESKASALGAFLESKASALGAFLESKASALGIPM